MAGLRHIGGALLPAFGLVIATVGSAEAELTASWVDNSGGEASFELERRGGDNPSFTLVARIPPRLTSYVDEDVVGGLTYCYRVRAVDGFEASAFSREACGVAPVEMQQTEQSNFNVTIRKSGSGTGSVASSPAGINCGDVCARSYAEGRVVILVATPGNGSKFDGWSGGCAGTAPCIVSGNSRVGVTATFSRLR